MNRADIIYFIGDWRKTIFGLIEYECAEKTGIEIIEEKEREYLYRFYWYCGSLGDIESLFLATPWEIKNLIGRKINFGKVRGKHKEISGIVEKDDIKLITRDPIAIEEVDLVGLNPLKYIVDEKEED